MAENKQQTVSVKKIAKLDATSNPNVKPESSPTANPPLSQGVDNQENIQKELSWLATGVKAYKHSAVWSVLSALIAIVLVLTGWLFIVALPLREALNKAADEVKACTSQLQSLEKEIEQLPNNSEAQKIIDRLDYLGTRVDRCTDLQNPSSKLRR